MIDSDPHSVLQSFPPLRVVCRQTTAQRPLLLLAKGNCRDLSKSLMLIKLVGRKDMKRSRRLTRKKRKGKRQGGFQGGCMWLAEPGSHVHASHQRGDGKMSIIVSCFLPSRVIKWALPKIERGLRWWIAKSWTNVHRTTIQSSCNHLWGVYVCQHEPGTEDKRWAGKTWNLPLCWRMTKNKQIF